MKRNRKKPPPPKPTGVLDVNAKGGPNFIEAYGWEWWRETCRRVDERKKQLKGGSYEHE